MANEGIEEKGEHSKSIDDRPLVMELFKKLKTELPALENLLEDCSGLWGYEDPIPSSSEDPPSPCLCPFSS